MENKGGVGAHRIHLAIGSPLSSEEVRGLGVPLRLGQDVADFVVGQAQYKLYPSGHQLAQWRHLQGFDIVVATRGSNDAAIDDFRVHLTRDAGHRNFS